MNAWNASRDPTLSTTSTPMPSASSVSSPSVNTGSQPCSSSDSRSAARPFYTHPLTAGCAAGFDLLFNGLEVTTGGQRLHKRQDLEDALRARSLQPASFEDHLRMFDTGMPPHGGLAIGLERLTTQVLGLSNVREASLYPRDRYRVAP